MTNRDWMVANAGYARQLISSAWNGASSAWQASPAAERSPFTSARSGGALLATAALGLATGAVSGLAATKQKRGSNAFLGGIIGGTLAIAGATAWGMRTVTGRMARGATRGVEERRNLRWLERNPINYA